MIRLAIVRQQYNPEGGAERFVTRALSALVASAAVEVTLLARHWRDGAGWKVRRIDPPYLTRTGRDRGFARAAAACFGDYDIVQSHERISGATIFRAGDGVHASWLAQLRRVDTTLTHRLRAMSRYHRYVLAAETAMFSHPALRHVICNSQMVAADIVSRFAVARGKVTVIYNGVDTAAFHPDLARFRRQWRSAHGVPASAPLLACVGSGFVRKGLATALSAIVPHAPIHLVVAGTDKRIARFQRTAARLGVADRVHFLGRTQDVRPVYGASDAFILPTLYDPFPNACLEALAAGLPIFTSPNCGAAEWVRAGDNGWVVDALDVDGYRAILDAWLSSRSRWEAMRAAARASAEPYTLARMASELQSLYERVVG